MISTQVFFTAETDVPDVSPPFKKGNTYDFWVTSRTANEEKIKASAIHKADLCYGLEISNLELCNQSGTAEDL